MCTALQDAAKSKGLAEEMRLLSTRVNDAHARMQKEQETHIQNILEVSRVVVGRWHLSLHKSS
jgi:uncharacterized protein YlxW (UPF0749 family)